MPAGKKGKGKAKAKAKAPKVKAAAPLIELDEFEYATAALKAQHGAPVRKERGSVLDSLVRTILSQNTTDKTSARAFASLKAAFPTWEAFEAGADEACEESIRVGGLAEIKSARIKSILRTLTRERGAMCLEYAHAMNDDAVKAELGRFKGVGPKTVACVMMFAMRRADFPVDTHVWHIAKKLRWVGQAVGREEAYELLNAAVPPHLKYDLHVLLVLHGKTCRDCAKKGKLQHDEVKGDCPLKLGLLKQANALLQELQLAAAKLGTPQRAVEGWQPGCEAATAVKLEPKPEAGPSAVAAQGAPPPVRVKAEPGLDEAGAPPRKRPRGAAVKAEGAAAPAARRVRVKTERYSQ